MSKFKSFKEYLRPKKCIALIKRIFASSSSSSRQYDRKRIAKHYSNDNNLSESMLSASSAEGFIPLMARDSEFIDLSFYNPNFNDRLEDEECDEDLDRAERDPIHSLFPDVNKELLNTRTSTAEVAKLLVGQKAHFGHSKKSPRNLLSAEQKLTSAQEMPQEKRNQSQSSATNTPALLQPANISAAVRQPQTRRSVSGNEASGSSSHNDDEDPNTSGRKMRLKRRKRSGRDTYLPTPAPPLTPTESYVGKVESHDSLLGIQEYKMNISPQRQREKARTKMMRRKTKVLQRKESVTTGFVADDEDNVD